MFSTTTAGEGHEDHEPDGDDDVGDDEEGEFSSWKIHLCESLVCHLFLFMEVLLYQFHIGGISF